MNSPKTVSFFLLFKETKYILVDYRGSRQGLMPPQFLHNFALQNQHFQIFKGHMKLLKLNQKYILRLVLKTWFTLSKKFNI